MPHMHLEDALAAIVGVAYTFHTSAMLVMIYHGFKYKTYGMPPISTAAAFGTAAICAFIGPWLQPHLFFTPSLTYFLVWTAWFLMTLVIIVQYLMWAGHHRTPWSDLSAFHLPKIVGRAFLFFLMAAVIALGEWAFIVFYQDYYVNEILPIAMFFVAGGYLATLFLRPKLRGLSLYVAWAWLIGNTLLYGATVAGGMENAYPNAEHGYDFMYWIFAITLILNAIYVILLTKRRDELKHDFEHDKAPLVMTVRDYLSQK